jgi:hypothetical protein
MYLIWLSVTVNSVKLEDMSVADATDNSSNFISVIQVVIHSAAVLHMKAWHSNA